MISYSRLKSKFWFFTFLLSLACNALFAQGSELKISCSNSLGLKAIAATVELISEDSTLVRTLFTDSAGQVVFKQLDSGFYHVSIKYFETIKSESLMINQKSTLLNFEMPVNEVSKVVIEAQKVDVMEDWAIGCGFTQIKLHNPFLTTMGGVYCMDGSIPTFGRLLNIQPYD